MNKRKKVIISNKLKFILIFGTIILGSKLYPINQQNDLSKSVCEIRKKSHVDTSSNAIRYFDVSEFDFIGKLPNTEKYSRLPEEAKDEVRTPVWNLSKNTAGIAVRFTSNTSSIDIRWKLDRNIVMSNMTPIGSKGFDLYTYKDGKWQFVGVAKPQNALDNHASIINGMQGEDREYLLNFPLYDGVSEVEIGIDQNAYIKKTDKNIIDRTRPIVFYGTSITQGASASRPGLTYSGLIQRRLNKEVINLGFSGNGQFEKEIGKYFMCINPGLIFLDCTPNSSAKTIRENLPELVEYIRSVNETVPIVFVESIVRDYVHFKKDDGTYGTLSYIQEQNRALNEIYVKYQEEFEHFYYLKSDDLIGDDQEATIDGTHFNDLGNYRAHQKFIEIIGLIYL